MLLPLKAIISKKPRKDGTSVIYFQYCYSSTNRVLLRTDIAVPAQFWNKKRQCISKSLPIECGDEEQLNNELSRMLKTIETIIEHGIANDVPNIGIYVSATFTPKFLPESLIENKVPFIPLKKKVPDFFGQIDDYIKSKEKKVCSTSAFTAMKERLLAYQTYSKTAITFASLDYNFYMNVVDFLVYDYQQKRRKEPIYGLKLSSIGSTIKNLRVFINDRVRRKIIAPIDLNDFKILDEESDAVYLTYEEIERIYSLDLTAYPSLQNDRDLFVLGSLTGLRFSDYSTLSFKDLRGNMLFKKTDKQDNWVVIPMREEANEIFVRQFKDKQPRISGPVFNRNIKQIAELAGIVNPVTFSYKKGNKDVVVTKQKAQWITSHTCRRSFCTNEYLAGTDINLIMKISGHKTYKDFFKYIKISQEEAARKVQEIWAERNNMWAFAKSA